MPYTLNKLASATGVSNRTIATAAGNTSTNSIGSFKIDAVTGINSVTIGYGLTGDVALTFTNEGSNFTKIKSRPSNFVFTGTVANANLTLDSGFKRTYTNFYNPAGNNCNSSVTRYINGKFNDQGFNQDALNYNTDFVSAITLFSPPRPSPTISAIARPPQPCRDQNGTFYTVNTYWGVRYTTVLPCYGATITVSYNMGTYGGVSGTGGNLYMSTNGTLGTLIATLANNSGSFTISSYLGWLLAGNTTYYITIINNFNCQSQTISVTTPAYV